MSMVLPVRRVPKIEDIERESVKVEKSDVFVVAEVPTQTDLIIQNSKTGEQYNALTILCKIANDIDEIKKSL